MIFIYLAFRLALAGPPIDLLDAHLYTQFNIPYTGDLYSGYLHISAEKEFHYMLYPSNTSKLILWLNGGPGCSSLQGAFNENGPFVFKDGTTEFMENPYSWTTFANMLYLETPAMVGFSFGDDHSSDAESASDNLVALHQFYKKFPELWSADFYIAGESYAGTYIPLLANEILEYNLQIPTEKQINLKGILIGNGCTDPTECTLEAKMFPYHKFNFLANHNILSPKLTSKLNQYTEQCKGQESQLCKDLYNEINMEKDGDGQFKFNPYNIYRECYEEPIISKLGVPVVRAPVSLEPFDTDIKGGHIAPCTDVVGLYHYLHDVDFLKFLHISDKSPTWAQCTTLQYTKDPRGVYYLYPKLISNGVRILKFSGDIDGVVPITGTLYWINKLQNEFDLLTIEAWRPWALPNKQNAGNVWVIEGLTFASVRNAGHMVPTDQREAASILISYFIDGKQLPIFE